MDEEFEKKVREVYDYIHGYGLRNSNVNISSEEDLKNIGTDGLKESDFVKCVHEGYRIGQDMIIAELIRIEKETKEGAKTLKEHRRNGNKEDAKNLEHELNKLRYQGKVYRNLADSLAWFLMHKQYWIARRHYSGDKNRPSLLHTNIESLHAVAANFYKEHPDGFVLYSDITSFIDISDLLLVDESLNMQPVEVKEGAKSKEVFEFIEKISKTDGFQPENMGLEEIENPTKFFDQVDRTLKQMEKGNRLSNILNNEEGPDPFSGQQTYIGEVKEPLRSYHQVLYDMFKTLEESTWAYECVENIVLIGMYRGESIPICDEIFKIAVSQKFPEKYPVTSYNQQLGLPIKEPFFQNPLGIDRVMDIIMGRVRVLLTVDINALIEFFNLNGFEAGWLSRKETHKLIESNEKRMRPFIFENRAIYLKRNGVELTLGDSFLSRLMYDNLSPSSLVDIYKASTEVRPDQQ